jgi:hypothetical protein
MTLEVRSAPLVFVACLAQQLDGDISNTMAFEHNSSGGVAMFRDSPTQIGVGHPLSLREESRNLFAVRLLLQNR